MVQYVEKYKKNIAIDMRKRGMSYSEIEHKLHVPKSTLSSWLKNVSLTEEHKERLESKRRQVALSNAQKRRDKTQTEIEEIKMNSARDIHKISKRELWLMGIMLYWRERLLAENNSDIKRGVNFTSSDPYLIKLFLKWLQEIGSITDQELQFDIFLDERKKESEKEVIKYWHDVTTFPIKSFSRVYYQKRNSKSDNTSRKGKRKTSQTKFGLLRIRVNASSTLVRQIAGWVRGIIDSFWS